MLYKDFLKGLTACPFCGDKNRIIAENESAYLTYSLAPYHKHQLLVTPRRHTELLLDLSEKEMTDIESLVTIGLRILKKLGYRNISVLEREGDSAGKSIPHLHTNIIPEMRIGPVGYDESERKILSEFEITALMTEIL